MTSPWIRGRGADGLRQGKAEHIWISQEAERALYLQVPRADIHCVHRIFVTVLVVVVTTNPPTHLDMYSVYREDLPHSKSEKSNIFLY